MLESRYFMSCYNQKPVGAYGTDFCVRYFYIVMINITKSIYRIKSLFCPKFQSDKANEDRAAGAER